MFRNLFTWLVLWGFTTLLLVACSKIVVGQGYWFSYV